MSHHKDVVTRGAVILDVNETLLDLAALDPLFARHLGDATARREWFATMLRSAFVATITDAYRPFGELGAAALDAVAAGRGVDLDEPAKAEILGGLRRLPPHTEVPGALARLGGSGMTVAALTNSTLEVAREQMAWSGLDRHLDAVHSADAVRRLKPAPEPYLSALEALAVGPQEAWMVAAHDWDLQGAAAVGLRPAYVARPGQLFAPPDLLPAVNGPDLDAVVEQILAAA